MGNYITVAVEYQQVEEALKLNQLDQILAPINERMVTDLETELALFMMKHGALSLGSPNTPIKKWPDVVQTASFLKDLGINTGENYAVMDPWAAQRLADAQSGLHTSEQLVRTAWENAQISGNFGGKLKVKAAPQVNCEAVKDSYAFTVTLSGVTASKAGFLKVGDQLQFDATHWLNQQSKQTLYNGESAIVLAEADSSAEGKVTVTLSGVPIFDTAHPQYNAVDRVLGVGDAVTIIGTARKAMKPNLFYNKLFCGLGATPLPKLHSIDSAVATYEGFSIRSCT